jgi:hypothetical protein
MMRGAEKSSVVSENSTLRARRKAEGGRRKNIDRFDWIPAFAGTTKESVSIASARGAG